MGERLGESATGEGSLVVIQLTGELNHGWVGRVIRRKWATIRALKVSRRN